jgi:hypothetical protein
MAVSALTDLAGLMLTARLIGGAGVGLEAAANGLGKLTGLGLVTGVEEFGIARANHSKAPKHAKTNPAIIFFIDVCFYRAITIITHV